METYNKIKWYFYDTCKITEYDKNQNDENNQKS